MKEPLKGKLHFSGNADEDTEEQAGGLSLAFKKSSFCSTSGCVEVAMASTGVILVRNNKDVTLKALAFTQEEWEAFVSGVKKGEFDI